MADTQALPALGSVTTRQLHWSVGQVLTSTLISLEIVELSPALWKWMTLRPASLTMRKSYLGLPQFCPFQPSGMPVLPSGWLAQLSTGTVCKSQKTGLVTYVVVRSGPADLGKWVTESRNVLEDFKKIYGDAPTEDVGAISLAIDSNDTSSTAESFFGEIFFRKP